MGIHVRPLGGSPNHSAFPHTMAPCRGVPRTEPGGCEARISCKTDVLALLAWIIRLGSPAPVAPARGACLWPTNGRRADGMWPARSAVEVSARLRPSVGTAFILRE